ncbi:MAG: radical SAM protein [Sedimentisphaerales bacterium]|nr:radical SAM protein [Sedimentisphaerales bacterium]
MKSKSHRYIFGPVPSRRLGLSLGIDIVPLKSCTLDCVYCQLGKSSDLTNERLDFVPVAEVIGQLKEKLEQRGKADYITISGSGEPSLNLSLGRIIDEIKKLTKIPIAILTNGTLLYDPAVRADCAKADVVLPSLDAGDAETFAKINRPHKGLHFDAIVDGLCQFRKEFKGQIWLEVFMVEGVNTGDIQLANIKNIIGRIKPDKVQLNTAVRPTTEPGIAAVVAEKMAAIAEKIGFNVEVIADYPQAKFASGRHIDRDGVLALLLRHPCSLDDVCSGLNITYDEASRHLTELLSIGLVISEEKGDKIFYKVK